MSDSNSLANELFLQVAAIKESWARRQFLELECGADPSLRQAVETLLQAHGRASEVPKEAQPVGATISTAALSATRTVTSGSEPTASGSPYFVKEQVEGVPLTAYCDTHQLSIPVQLKLFVQICAEVQRAHQKGIIHGDLKPGNILVTRQDGKLVPKVIDLRLQSNVNTTIASVITSWPYLAPEQTLVNPVDVDTRTDVYGLGVILYELLTGTTPLTRETLETLSQHEAMRLIREQVIPAPSSRLSSSESIARLAANRQLRPVKLQRVVKGELDWIAMKAVSKDRDRRYETAFGFAQEIERFLKHEPVQAAPADDLYPMKKFVRRNRLKVLAASSFLVIGFCALMVWIIHWESQLSSADLERDRALASQLRALDNRDVALHTALAFRADLEESSDEAIELLMGSKAELSPNEKIYLEKSIERWRAVSKRLPSGSGNRDIRADVHFRVANLLKKIGRNDESLMEFRAGRDLHEIRVDQNPIVPRFEQELVRTQNKLGNLLVEFGKPEEASVEFRVARDLGKSLVARFPTVPAYRFDLAIIRTNLGNQVARFGNSQEARLEYLASFELLKEIVELVPTNREYEQKLVYTLQLLVEQFPTRPEYQRDLARTHFRRGELLESDGRWEESCKEYALARDVQKKLLQQFPAKPQYQQELADTHYKLGNVLGGLPNRDEARGNSNSGLNKPKRSSKGLHGSDKKRDEARKEYVAAIEIQKKLVERFPDVPERQQELADIQIDLGILLASQSHWQAARVEFVSAMNLKKTLAARFPEATAHPIDLASIYGHIGNAIRNEGKPAESLEWFDLAIQTLKRIEELEPPVEPAHQYLQKSHYDRACAYDSLHQVAEATADWDRALERSPNDEKPRIRLSQAKSRLLAGQGDEAMSSVRTLSEESTLGDDHWYESACLFAVASGKIAAKKQHYADRAMEFLNESLKADFRDTDLLKKNTDLDSLRDREDFKRLLAELEKK